MSSPTLSMASSRIWIGTANPVASETNIEQGNLFFNSTTNNLWTCSDATEGALVWQRFVRGSQTQYALKGIDGKTVASSLILTTDPGSARFYVTYAHVGLVSVADFVSPPTISLGSNAASYDNIATTQAMTGLNLQYEYHGINILAAPASVAASTGIYLNLSVGAVATTYTVDVYIVGFYL